MVLNEFTDIEYHFVKNNKLLATLDSSVELGLWYTRLLLHLPFNFTRKRSPMVEFAQC